MDGKKIGLLLDDFLQIFVMSRDCGHSSGCQLEQEIRGM